MGDNTPVHDILERKDPGRFVYAPNYWQWFAHHKNHSILPKKIAHCQSQLDLINSLGLDVFSRNIYCRQDKYWFGGLCKETVDGFEAQVSVETHGDDTITTKLYRNASGALTERLKYAFKESTVVQDKFLVDNYSEQLKVLTDFVHSRRWNFLPKVFRKHQDHVGPDGIVIAGELYSPLKMLHLMLGPVDTTYIIMDNPDLVDELIQLHEKAQLDLVEQMVKAGVKVVMAMDNLDTFFHPPMYVEKYSSSFYERASRICHDHGSTFFIHACGKQKDNLKYIASLGVDGLEGVAYPPLGDVSLTEAMEMTGDRFILTGGISAAETKGLTSRKDVFNYVKNLFIQMRPYRNRFIFSASCNTPIDTPYETICWFRDAWQEYKEIE